MLVLPVTVLFLVLVSSEYLELMQKRRMCQVILEMVILAPLENIWLALLQG